MTKYEIVYTVEAEADLLSIQYYISSVLNAPMTAQKQVKKIVIAIKKLEHMPLRHRLYQEEPWHSRGLRFLIVDNFLVFYVVAEQNNIVAIIRIMYGKRNIDWQLSGMNNL